MRPEGPWKGPRAQRSATQRSATQHNASCTHFRGPKGPKGPPVRSHRRNNETALYFFDGSAHLTPRACQSVGERGNKSYPARSRQVALPGRQHEAGRGGGVGGVATQCFCLSLCLLYVYSMSTSCLDVSMCLNVYLLLVHARFSRPSKVHTSASATLPDVNSMASPHAADP